MTFEEFREHCGSPIMVSGFTLREGQTHPEDYAGLVDFIADRLRIDEPPFSAGALAKWLMDRTGSDNPHTVECEDMNTAHVSTVLLIGELPDPDGYVASLPDEDDKGMYLPPTHIVRDMLNTRA